MAFTPPSRDDPNALLRAAEAAFGAGRAAEARPLLEAVLRMVPGHPQLLQFHAIVLQASGDIAGAHRSAAAAHAAAPADPRIADTLGNLLAELDRREEALDLYDKAIARDPNFVEARLHRAVTLQDLGRIGEARMAYAALASDGRAGVRPLVGGAGLEVEDGNLDAAAALLDRALARTPADPAALRGRARVAVDRGEADASSRLATTRATLPDDRDVLLNALEAIGDGATEAETTRALAADPGWHDGRRALAKLRRQRGRPDWLALHEAAVAERPRDPGGWRELVGLHAAVTDYAAAAATGRRAATATGAREFLVSAFGFHAAAGEMGEAASLLADPSISARIEPLARAKYLLRRRDPLAAERVLAPLTRSSGNPEAWALRGVAWQALGDRRWEWLNGQDGLVQALDLGLDVGERAAVTALLRRLHKDAVLHIGQSVRGGTQTVGNLFARVDPELRRLKDAIFAALEHYRGGLPPADPAHPLLCDHDTPFRMTASWSVRLTGGGFHISHIHPKGVISSASYWAVPSPDEGGDAHAGWLELGRPPSYLALDLPPIATIEPVPGRLVLFPSTLHHGTRAFTGGERITAAFDLAPAPSR